jgi:hypothetical protein
MAAASRRCFRLRLNSKTGTQNFILHPLALLGGAGTPLPAALPKDRKTALLTRDHEFEPPGKRNQNQLAEMTTASRIRPASADGQDVVLTWHYMRPRQSGTLCASYVYEYAGIISQWPYYLDIGGCIAMSRLTFIDLFCGCGGFGLGLERAGLTG